MVPKKALKEIFNKEIKNQLFETYKQQEISSFLKEIEKWFTDFKKENLEKEDFEQFLNNFEEEIKKLLENLDKENKLKIKKYLSFFLIDLIENCNEELANKIKTIIKKNLGRKYLTKENKSIIMDNKNLIITILVVLTSLFIVGLLIYSFQSNNNNEIQTDTLLKNNDTNYNTNNNTINKTILKSEFDINKNNDTIKNTQNTSENISKTIFELNTIEKEIVNKINIKRSDYYLKPFKIDLNLSEILENTSIENPIGELKIENFSMEIKDTIIVNSDNISEDILNQLNKRQNDFYTTRFTHIGIHVKKKDYKLYLIRIIMY